MVAAAVIGAVGTVAGGVMSSRASGKAADAQVQSTQDASNTQLQAQRESIAAQTAAQNASIAAQTAAQNASMAFQQKQNDQARADTQPWRDVGANALSQLTSRTGAGGDLMQQSTAFSTPFNFTADPGYAFRLQQGQDALNNQAAARGGVLSGAQLKGASTFNQNFASNEYGSAYNRYQTDQGGQFNRDQTNQANQFNRLASIAGVGQTAANQNASGATSLGNSVGSQISATGNNIGNTMSNTGNSIAGGMMNTGNNIAQNQIGAGNAQASGYLAAGNALQGSINQGISAFNGFNGRQNALTNSAGDATNQTANFNYYGTGYSP